jgi:hypothetical protein
MRCTSLSIGITEYRANALRNSDTRLHFAVTDAEALYRYTSLAWPTAEANNIHLLLCDEAASATGIEQAFIQIEQAGSFDLAILYLSGHGQRGPDNSGWFCLWDATPDTPSLDRVVLDRLLGRIDCSSVLLILDCCHAESIISGVPFFADLQGRQARLFCASSRADERAWEDLKLQRSVLSHVLFLGLSQTSALADITGHVSIGEQLFPFLRDQVPLVAAKVKSGSIQQPVVGGLAAIGMRLPTVQAGSIGRSLTLREILRNQVRRLIIWSVATVLFALLLIEAFWTHLAISGDQAIVLRPGIASTFSLLPVHLGKVVDTGFRGSQLDPMQDEAMQKLANGEFRTVSTQRTLDGLRQWIDLLTPMLKDRIALNFIHPIASGEGDDPDSAITFTAINFAARTMDTDPAVIASKQQLLLHAPLMPVSCTVLGNEQVVQFEIAQTGSLEDYIRAFIRYGAAQGKDPSAEVWKLARFIAHRSRDRNYDPTAQLEAQVLLEEIARSNGLTLSPQTLSELRAVLPPAQPNTCSPLAIGILIALGKGEDKAGAEALLRADDPTSKQAMVDILNAFRRIGAKYDYLIELPRSYFSIIGNYRPLLAETVQDMESWLDGQVKPETERLLEHVAMRPQAYNTLYEQLQSTEDPMRQGIAARYLARSFAWQSQAQKEGIQKWLVANASMLFPGSDITLGAALLGRQRQVDPRIIDRWIKQLSVGVIDPQSEFEEYHLIVVDARDAVAALAIAAGTTPIPDKALEQVELLLANRNSIPLRKEAIEGLGSLLRNQRGALADGIRDRLMDQRGNARRRLLTVDIAIAAINGLPDGGRITTLRSLAAFWRNEPEPELRRALGLILARVD